MRVRVTVECEDGGEVVARSVAVGDGVALVCVDGGEARVMACLHGVPELDGLAACDALFRAVSGVYSGDGGDGEADDA